MNITSIHPLGLKDFGESLSSLDGSSEDNGPQLKNWPLYALYQPDTIAVFEDKGKVMGRLLWLTTTVIWSPCSF